MGIVRIARRMGDVEGYDMFESAPFKLMFDEEMFRRFMWIADVRCELCVPGLRTLLLKSSMRTFTRLARKGCHTARHSG